MTITFTIKGKKKITTNSTFLKSFDVLCSLVSKTPCFHTRHGLTNNPNKTESHCKLQRLSERKCIDDLRVIHHFLTSDQPRHSFRSRSAHSSPTFNILLLPLTFSNAFLLDVWNYRLAFSQIPSNFFYPEQSA